MRARRTRLRDGRRLPVHVRRLSPRADGSRWRRDRAPRCEVAHRRSGRAPRRDRLRQLSRHLDAAQRRHRVALRAHGVRRARRPRARLVHQVDDRSPAGRQRRAGIVATALALHARLPAADDQPDDPIRPATWTSCPRTAGRKVDAALCNCLGFGSKNSAIVLGRRMPDDVLVVGAGPAGSVAALVLARAGVKVTLLDRSGFPRDKLCGDSINPGAMGLLRAHGLATAIEHVGVPIRGMLVTGPGNTEVNGRYAAGICGRSIRRRDLDTLLLDAAIRAGADSNRTCACPRQRRQAQGPPTP